MVQLVQIKCPSCGKVLSAKGEHAGKQAKCSGCGGTVRIPAARPEAPKPAAPEPATPAPPRCVKCGGESDLMRGKYHVFKSPGDHKQLQNLTDWICSSCIRKYAARRRAVGLAMLGAGLLIGIVGAVLLVSSWPGDWNATVTPSALISFFMIPAALLLACLSLMFLVKIFEPADYLVSYHNIRRWRKEGFPFCWAGHSTAAQDAALREAEDALGEAMLKLEKQRKKLGK